MPEITQDNIPLVIGRLQTAAVAYATQNGRDRYCALELVSLWNALLLWSQKKKTPIESVVGLSTKQAFETVSKWYSSGLRYVANVSRTGNAPYLKQLIGARRIRVITFASPKKPAKYARRPPQPSRDDATHETNYEDAHDDNGMVHDDDDDHSSYPDDVV